MRDTGLHVQVHERVTNLIRNTVEALFKKKKKKTLDLVYLRHLSVEYQKNYQLSVGQYIGRYSTNILDNTRPGCQLTFARAPVDIFLKCAYCRLPLFGQQP